MYMDISERTMNYVHLPFTDSYYVPDLYISHDSLKRVIVHTRQMKSDLQFPASNPGQFSLSPALARHNYRMTHEGTHERATRRKFRHSEGSGSEVCP